MATYQAYFKTPLGYAEISATEQAVLSVKLVTKNGGMNDKTKDLPEVLKQCIRELEEYFQGKRTRFSVKLDANGTDFQKKVWSALEKIPYGKTYSYADIAMAIGNPKAVRAVGLANSKNPHWILVPCHRVIGKNGKLTGYAGGLDRKQWLLEHESKNI